MIYTNLKVGVKKKSSSGVLGLKDHFNVSVFNHAVQIACYYGWGHLFSLKRTNHFLVLILYDTVCTRRIIDRH